jgi:DNA-binding SARP family transcriptional activator
MTMLRMSLFGGVRVWWDDAGGDLKLTRSVQALLAYLLVQRHRTHRREVLAGVFWGEHTDERARSCLTTAMWRLRRALEPAGVRRGTFVEVTPLGEVGFNAGSRHWLDVAEFEQCISRPLARPLQSLTGTDIDQVRAGLSLYTGDLLEGFYDDWAVRERERLRSLYLDGLACLMLYYRDHGDPQQGITWGQELLRHDPLREEVHRARMRLYLVRGPRALAARQYEQCRDLLATEMGIPPMEETRALYLAVAPERARDEPGPAPASAPLSLRQVLQQLTRAAQGVDEAQTRLQHAIHLAEELLRDRDRPSAGADLRGPAALAGVRRPSALTSWHRRS